MERENELALRRAGSRAPLPPPRHGTHLLARLAAVRHRAALLALAELALRAAVAAEVEREAALAFGLAVLGLAAGVGLRRALAAILLARLAIGAAAVVVVGPLVDCPSGRTGGSGGREGDLCRTLPPHLCRCSRLHCSRKHGVKVVRSTV